MTEERGWKLLKKSRVLVGSPVCQKPAILKAFLDSLRNLKQESISVDFIFVDDNKDEASGRTLAEFLPEASKVVILPGKAEQAYLCDEESHHWNDALMHKVADFKNMMIEYALANQYDYLFLADSDLILHPDLLELLRSCQKDIVSEVFWTRWHEGLPPEPNVWLYDEYDLTPKKLGEQLSAQEAAARRDGFLARLRKPGIYEVGGLGACTLISRSALQRGVSFAPIPNLTIHGEDRFFCIRAAVLGLGLYVDTRSPAYHIYREQDLEGVLAYVQSCLDRPRSLKPMLGGQRITLSMVVRNEEGRYLSRVLKGLAGHIDEAVIIDDGSIDGTVGLCRSLLKEIPLHIIQNPASMFDNEVELRKKQWDETIKTNPDWILNLDADEVIEESFWNHAGAMVGDPANDVCCFRLYDMWSETQYREDAFWNAQAVSRAFLLRYRPNHDYQWRETPQHCGRFPQNIEFLPRAKREFRVKHFGWATPADRAAKYGRYQRLDPGARYGSREQYATILDANPHLVSWREQ